MAKVSTMRTPDELGHLAQKCVQKRDRYILGVVQSQRRLLSRAKRRELSRTASVHSPMKGRGSLFKYFAPFWHDLTGGQKDVWKQAAAVSGLNGWQLFISDSAARIKNSLEFGFDPNIFWQVRTGKILILAPENKIKLVQEHPLNYWVTQKMRGKPWKQELKFLSEYFSLPLTLTIRYKSNLIASGSTQKARYYAVVTSSYQGVDRQNIVECNIAPNNDWTLATATLSSVIGYITGYSLYIEIEGYIGTLLIDNLRCEHGAFNWVRDPRCDDISKIFIKQFALVKPFWEKIEGDENAQFDTVFPPAL